MIKEERSEKKQPEWLNKLLENHERMKDIKDEFLVEYYKQIKMLYDSVLDEIVYRICKKGILKDILKENEKK